jgi:hypothetical protein
MAGLDPAIHVLLAMHKNVDARHKAGHDDFRNRHCERSEAIYLSSRGGMDCFVARAPRNDVEATRLASPQLSSPGSTGRLGTPRLIGRSLSSLEYWIARFRGRRQVGMWRGWWVRPVIPGRAKREPGILRFRVQPCGCPGMTALSAVT